MRRLAAVAILVLVAACKLPETPDSPVLTGDIDAQVRQAIGTRAAPVGPMPAQSPALVELGRDLLFDKILSGNRDVSCATCHQPALGMADGLSLSIGTGGTGVAPARTLGVGRRFVVRNAPSLLNDGVVLSSMFWDGRLTVAGQPTAAGVLELDTRDPALPAGMPSVVAAQAMLPVLSRREMRGDPGDQDVFGAPNELAQLADSQNVAIWQGLMNRLLAIPGYQALFAAAYPGVPSSALRFQHAAVAIAAFEMDALTRVNSPFDRYLNRDDNALTLPEKRGALLFFGKAQCATCHAGTMLGGQSVFGSGIPAIGDGPRGAPLDFGRGAFDSSSNGQLRFAFRTPALRNVELTAPYMHDGAFATLDAVVRHYNDVPASLSGYDPSQLDPAVRAVYHGDDSTMNQVLKTLNSRLRTPLNLTDDEISDLVGFLKSLTDPSARNLGGLVPASVPSGLPVD